MAVKTERRKIGGVEWTVTQMAPTASVPLQIQFAGILAEAVGPLSKATSGDVNAVTVAVGAVVAALNKSLPPQKLFDLMSGLITSGLVWRDGKEPDIDVNFTGEHMADIYFVTAFILEVNFGGLLKGLGLGAVVDKAKEQMDSLPTPQT